MTDVDMAVSGMITFGLLIALIDCLNGQNAPTHPVAVLFKAKERSAVITCDVGSSTLQSSVLHWYRAQPGGAFQRLMYFEAGSTKATNDQDTPRRFAGTVKSPKVSLSISKVQFDDAGSYYCALWTGDNNYIKRFGTGTRLIVTDKGKDTVIPPTLTGYLPSKKQSGKQTVLCQAKDMFPDLVKFTWKKQSNTGGWTDVSEANVVEQRNENDNKVTVTSMLIYDQNTDVYQCSVIHEGGNKEPQSKTLKEEKKEKKEEKSDDATENTTCPPNNGTSGYQEISGSSDQIPSRSLFVYAYAVMIMKNGLYFCAVFIFLLKRKVGKKEESS